MQRGRLRSGKATYFAMWRRSRSCLSLMRPGELTPVFDAMLERATRLSEAAFGILWTYDDGRFRAVSFRNVPPAYVEFLREPVRAEPLTAIGRIAAGEAVAHIPDITTDEYL